jgi:hypothetical protein
MMADVGGQWQTDSAAVVMPAAPYFLSSIPNSQPDSQSQNACAIKRVAMQKARCVVTRAGLLPYAGY